MPTLRAPVRRPARERCTRAARAWPACAAWLRPGADAALLPRRRACALGRGPASAAHRRAVVFSSSMAQYATAGLACRAGGLRRRRFGQVDRSTPPHRWPMSWLYRREARCCWPTSARLAARGERAFFVTEQGGRRCFAAWRPSAGRVLRPMGNGVDAEYFAPDPQAGQSRSRRASCRWCSPAPWTTGPTSTRCAGSPGCCRGCAQRAGRRCASHRRAQPAAGRAALAGEAVRSPARCPTCGPTCSMRRWWWRRCGWRAASRTRCWRPWRWAGRSWQPPSCARPSARATAQRAASLRRRCGDLGGRGRPPCLRDASRACGASAVPRREQRAARLQLARPTCRPSTVTWRLRPTPAAAAAGQVAEAGMNPERLIHKPSSNRAGRRGAVPAGAAAAGWLAMLLLYRDTAVAMVQIWSRSDTFAHAFWCRRSRVAGWRKRAAPGRRCARPAAAGCCCRWPPSAALWLAGELVAANAVTQFALVRCWCWRCRRC
jgi:hypothetical protein